MRAILSRWSMMLAAVTCLSLLASTGCKTGVSMPGSDWLSWAKRPSATSLAANQYPQRPSANALPNPSATTNPQSTYPGFGAPNNYAANQSGGTTGYNTGPYSMAGQSSAAAAANRARLAADSYPNQSGSQGQSSAPYQSPYSNQRSATSTSNPYTATADSRNSYANSYSNSAARNSYPATPASGARAGQMLNGASGPYSGQTAKSTYPATAPASYPQTQPYGSTAQPYGTSPAAPSNGYSATSTYGATARPNYGAATAANTANLAPYRPGTTNRNGGQLPSSPSLNAGGTGSGYPGASYPSTGSSSSYSYPSSGSSTR
jgi:hypothetical protein